MDSRYSEIRPVQAMVIAAVCRNMPAMQGHLVEEGSHRLRMPRLLLLVYH